MKKTEDGWLICPGMTQSAGNIKICPMPKCSDCIEHNGPCKTCSDNIEYYKECEQNKKDVEFIKANETMLKDCKL